ncbi:MAG: hypothetical protein LKK13_01740 [Bacilli bacterium]|jgi:hypothetical protein|nr:hypothetical protein [Bacilli bacterium]
MPKVAYQPHQKEYRRLESVLGPIASFSAKHASLTVKDFNYHSVHDLPLFSIEPDLDFFTMEETCDRIEAALPALKRIFAKPIINLTDADEVLPVENVRIINQATIQHLGAHTENVNDITAKGLKPEKLLTRVYLDDYAIYENLVFCNLVDSILSFARNGVSLLRDLVYANETIEFNLLERVNHLNYFLSIGKLHMGYVRYFDKYYASAKRIYEKMKAISAVIVPRLHKPVYRLNKVRNRKLPLRKTNIFLMQKDYRQVYRLEKWMLEKGHGKDERAVPVDLGALRLTYYEYVEYLLVFALQSFSFATSLSAPIKTEGLDIVMAFKGWTARLIDERGKGVFLRVRKKKERTILLVPEVGFELTDPLASPGVSASFDEVIPCTPYEKEIGNPKAIFLSPENVESFRRLQQVLLRAMIYCDPERKDCPFCEGSLTHNDKEGYDECDRCHTRIVDARCDDGTPYIYTTIDGKRPEPIRKSDFSKDEEWLYKRKAEALLHFRNITPIDEKGEIVCPICGKVHKKKRYSTRRIA